ncbi:MAG: four helix bundle protein [Bacteroidetes bacterium]|jgi:four helix bundle protein|nr:four helix bundle protein [Bacteroidota bacterium]
MTKDLKDRTKKFAVAIIRFIRTLPKNDEGSVLGKQLLRSGTSVGANYRSACKGKSTADFINKIIIVEEEADECCYWLELIIEAELAKKESVEPILKEANELTAIFTAAGKTAKENRLKQQKN